MKSKSTRGALGAGTIRPPSFPPPDPHLPSPKRSCFFEEDSYQRTPTTTVPAASVLSLRENPRRPRPARCATWFGNSPNVRLNGAPWPAGMIAPTTSVPGTAAHQAQRPAGRHEVTTRFTKGCVGERPAPAMGTKERSPTNPLVRSHRRTDVDHNTPPPIHQPEKTPPYHSDRTAPLRPLTATALSGKWHTNSATPPGGPGCSAGGML